jgi:hypothetical protein
MQVQGFREVLAHRVSFQIDLVSVVYESIHYGIGQWRQSAPMMPVNDGKLAGDERGFSAMSVLKDFKEIPELITGQRRQSPVVENEQVDLGERFQQTEIPTFSPRGAQFGEQTAEPVIQDGISFAAGFMAEGTGKP